MRKVVVLFLFLAASIGLAGPTRPTDPSPDFTPPTPQATKLP